MGSSGTRADGVRTSGRRLPAASPRPGNSATLGEAYGRWSRFYRLIVDFIAQKVERTRNEARIVAELEPGLRLPVMVEDWIVARWLSLGRSLVGRRWTPRRVAFRHAGDGDPQAYEQWFDAPVAFESIKALSQKAAWCLDTYKVKYSHSVHSLDRKRMLCFYAAPDAEAVRSVQREARAPVSAIWAGTTVAPA